MVENDNIQKYIQQFIQENRKIYTREAITQKLIEAGYFTNDIHYAYDELGLDRDVVDKPKNKGIPTSGDWRSASPDGCGFMFFFPLFQFLPML